MNAPNPILMDKLSDLPPKNDTVKTADEAAIMNMFFPDAKEDLSPSSRFSKINWKIVGTASLLFVLLANPWVDNLFCKIPYCGDNIFLAFGLKILLFMLFIIIAYLFF